VLPTLRLSREFGLVFCGGAFFKACGLLVPELVLIEICLFLADLFCGLPFFRILWHFCCFNLLLTAYWACFYENLLIFNLFFSDLPPYFFI